MIVQNEIKLIYYSDSIPQMFNLTSDPNELDNWFDHELYQQLMTSKTIFTKFKRIKIMLEYYRNLQRFQARIFQKWEKISRNHKTVIMTKEKLKNHNERCNIKFQQRARIFNKKGNII